MIGHATVAGCKAGARLALGGLLALWLVAATATGQYSPPPALPSLPGSGSADPADPFAPPPATPGGQLIQLPDGRHVRVAEDTDAPSPRGRPTRKPQAGDKPLTKEQQEAAAVLQKYVSVQQLPRTAAQTLRAKAERCARKPAAGKPDQAGKPDDAAKVQEFYGNVVTGDWKAIKSHLAALPKEAGSAVYTYLVVLLAKDKQAFVLPDEIPALADASPGELDEAQLTAIAQLLAQTYEKLGLPKAMLARLEQGTERLGGQDPKKRLTAARLLAGAGMVDQAFLFLPSMHEVYRADDPVLINLYASCLQAMAERSPHGGGFNQAWDLTQRVLDRPQLTDEAKADAIKRTVALVPLMPERTTSAWVKRQFPKRPDLGMAVLAEAAQRVEATFPEKSPEPRVMALAAQQRLIEALLSAGGKSDPRWLEAVGLMTLGWINEAAYTIAGSDHSNAEGPPLDAFNECDLSNPAVREKYRQALSSIRSGNEIPRLPGKVLLAFAPGDAWRKVLAPDVAWQVSRLIGKLAAEVGDRPRTFAAIRSVAGRDPAAAKELVELFLATWAGRLTDNPNASGDPFRARRYGGYSSPFSRGSYSLPPGYGNPSGYGNYAWRQNGSVPLIRARQVRNLAELAELLSAIGALTVPPPDDRVVIAALDACHSPAEVYREQDLKQVFGDLDRLQPDTTLQLVSAIRMKLAGQWRQPELQEQLGTQRTDKEQVAEVLRGYELAQRLLGPLTADDPGRADAVALQATVWFDLAEFLYGQNADLKTYTATRDRAFKAYRKAAELYAAMLPKLSAENQSAAVFCQWFQSALGASDLAHLTRQDRPDLDEIGRVSAAIRGLREPAADRHLRMFGEAITASMGELPPHLKPHFFRQALRVLGDHPAARTAGQQLKFYDDLLGEVQLGMTLDGNADVGHNQPFGVHLSIRYTNALGRESGGFVQLLQKTNSPISNREIDYPKEIERTLAEKLRQTFDIQFVRFHEPKVAGRGFGRPDWRETPLAYLVLRAKTPAVDRIPAVPIDLEFNDGVGVVLLPVSSPVVLIDARPALPAPRPVADLKVRQVLDDRRLETGAAQLEIVVTGRGLIPSLDHLLELNKRPPPGFRVVKLHDQGVEIKSLDAGDQIRPVCERRWLAELAPTPDGPPPRFEFSKACDAAMAMTYQRYSDADIIVAGPVVPLHDRLLSPRTWLPALGAAGGLALAVVLAVIVYRRVRQRDLAAVRGPCYHCPDPLTPFTLLDLLRRIHSDESLPMGDGDRSALGGTIADLQQQFFERSTEPNRKLDLAPIADRWLAAAASSRRPKHAAAKPHAA